MNGKKENNGGVESNEFANNVEPFLVWMFELQAIASLIVIYLLSLVSCYAALKAQCRGVCNMNYYTYNVSEICIINNVCQTTNKNLLQANIQFLPTDSRSGGGTDKTHDSVPLQPESVSLSQNARKSNTLLCID